MALGVNIATSPVAPGKGQPDRANRFFRTAAAGTGDPADGNGKIGAAQLQHGFRHFPHHRFANGAMLNERGIIDTEH